MTRSRAPHGRTPREPRPICSRFVVSLTKPRPSKLEGERLLGTHPEAHRTNLRQTRHLIHMGMALSLRRMGAIGMAWRRVPGTSSVKRSSPSVAAHTHQARETPPYKLKQYSNNGRRYTRHKMYSNPIGRRISHDPPLLAAYAFHGVVRVHRCIYRETSVRLAGSDLLDDFRVSRRERSRWFRRVRS